MLETVAMVIEGMAEASDDKCCWFAAVGAEEIQVSAASMAAIYRWF